MARYNEILAGRYNRFVQKLFQMKGAPPTPQLSGDVQMNMAFFTGLEHRYLESWDTVGGFVDGQGGAGQFVCVQLSNHAGSNIVAVIEKILISTTIQDEFDLSTLKPPSADPIDLSVINNSWQLDARSRNKGTLILSNDFTSPTFGAVLNRFRVALNATFDVIGDEGHQLPVLPGQSYRLVQRATANTRVLVHFLWRERALEEGERS